MTAADRPRRRIPGTDCVAVTLYASADRSVRHYAILNGDGSRLGTVAYHPRGRIRAAGYHRGTGQYDARTMAPLGRNLTEAAQALLAEGGQA
jgi:hypothetical protein